MLLGGDTEFIVEGVMPDLFHIVPVGDDTVFNGVLQSEDTWSENSDIDNNNDNSHEKNGSLCLSDQIRRNTALAGYRDQLGD